MRELLAALMHEMWSGWMRYLFDRSEQLPDGSVRIPPWAVTRWTRQMKTPYRLLSEEEKVSDQREADKVIAVLEEDQ